MTEIEQSFNSNIPTTQDFSRDLPVMHRAEFGGKQKYAVNSWELFQKLGLRLYSVWCSNEILDIGNKNTDFIFVVSNNKNRKGRPRKEYLLSLDFAKHLVLQSRTDFGKFYRQYLIDFEEQHRDKVVQLSQTQEAAKFFTGFLESFKQISPTAYLTMGAKISKEVFGIEVPQRLLPETEHRLCAKELAERLGKTPQAIGKLANQLGLKRKPLGIPRLSVAPHVNKEVAVWYYNDEAVRMIEAHYKNTESLF